MNTAALLIIALLVLFFTYKNELTKHKGYRRLRGGYWIKGFGDYWVKVNFDMYMKMWRRGQTKTEWWIN